MVNKELHELITPELQVLGLELVKCEVVGSSRNPVVRLFIDKPGGVSIDDCTLVSRTVSLLLDREDPFPGKYLLEVSSPGSDRPLVTEAHFARYVGEPVKVQWATPGGERTTHTGRLESVGGGTVTVETDDGSVAIDLDSIIKAHLIEQEYKIDKKMKKDKKERRGKRRKDGQK